LDQLHVFNIDHHPELSQIPELASKIHGWGETAIVKDGKIVFVAALGKDQKRIPEICEELLRIYSS
jgi:hypothetical protein